MSPSVRTVRTVLTPTVVSRLVLGWAAFTATVLARRFLATHLPTPVLIGLLVGVVAVIVVLAFGVVTEAEHLAGRLGDPYGTLVLTLSIVMVEVVLICAVMLGPGDHATVARDSVMAVSMIILNLVIGIALLVGGLRHRNLRPNRSGVFAYLSMLAALGSVTFALPGIVGSEGAYTPWQALPMIVLTVLVYGFFLVRQVGARRGDFQEMPPAQGPARPLDRAARHVPPPVLDVLAEHRAEVILRALVLVATVTPIVLLSHTMAALLDDGLDRIGAPAALSGILIAMIVFLPETLTTIRAARAGEIQRVSNLCHGALVSTVGLTVPAVLVIGLATGQAVVLAETPTNLVLLGVTLMLTSMTFFRRRVTAVHGAAHLVVFAIYGLTVFA